MKRLLGLLILTFSLSACAQHHGHRHHGHHHGNHSNYNWVVPAAIGGLIVYGVTRQNQEPVVVEQYPYPYPPQYTNNCTEWREIYRNGIRYLERTCFNR